MISLDIRADLRDAYRAANVLERKAIPNAAAGALNDARRDTAREGAKLGAEAVGAEKWAIGKRYLRRGVRNARRDRLETSWYVGTMHMPIDKSRRRKSRVEGRKGRKSYAFGAPVEESGGVRAGRHFAPGAFLATVQETGHHGAFERFGPKRVARKGRYRGQRRQRIAKPKVPIGRELEVATETAMNTAGARAWRRSFAARFLIERRKVWSQ